MGHLVRQTISYADSTVDALDNDETKVDFKPLYQCIHIYDALECKPELQRSYQQDRKVGSTESTVADSRLKPHSS